mmetsp:Transcript_37227/g.93458  ORF Transcript_37227/g.93458 Transcript_37227/m.93458 type:complete len:214 (-) Transcript_37227:1739-2380(-)
MEETVQEAGPPLGMAAFTALPKIGHILLAIAILGVIVGVEYHVAVVAVEEALLLVGELLKGGSTGREHPHLCVATAIIHRFGNWLFGIQQGFAIDRRHDLWRCNRSIGMSLAAIVSFDGVATPVRELGTETHRFGTLPLQDDRTPFGTFKVQKLTSERPAQPLLGDRCTLTAPHKDLGLTVQQKTMIIVQEVLAQWCIHLSQGQFAFLVNRMI